MSLNKSELFTIRDAVPEDYNFIMATWLRGLYYGDSWFSEIPKQVFMEAYHKVVHHIVTNPSTTVKVACLISDKDAVLGYSVSSQHLKSIHWVFVKKAWRGIGIAKCLLPEDTTTATHLTKVGLSIIKRKGFTFNPFLV